jgi:hypothetical protein
MADYRTMFDEKWIKAWDLAGKEWTLIIRKVEAGVLEGRSKRKDRKPVLYFRGASKPLALNKTNAKTIATLYGYETDGWVGKLVTLYAAKTSFGDEEDIDCIRIRPREPKGKPEALPNRAPPAEHSDRCDSGSCGQCSMCLEVADAERAATEGATP